MSGKARVLVGIALFAVFCVWLVVHTVNYVTSQNAALTDQIAALEGKLGKTLEERLTPISAQLNSVAGKVSTDLPSKDSFKEAAGAADRCGRTDRRGQRLP